MDVDTRRARPDLEAAVAEFRSGGGAVVIVESADGAAGAVIAGLPPGLEPSVRAAAGEATRGRVGCLAEELGLEGIEGQIVAVEQAQWADPTSLGRLQRYVRDTTGPFLLIVAYQATPGAEDWGIDRLAGTAEEHRTLYRLRVDEVTTPAAPEDPAARDLVVASSLMSDSISVSAAARLLGVSEGEALEIAEDLVRAGHLHQTRRGFHSIATTAALGVGEARVGHIAGRLASVLQEGEGDPAVVGSLLLVADDPAAAHPHLVAAARMAVARGAAGEAYHLATAALEASSGTEVPGHEAQGELHLMAGRYLRAAGRSEAAASHLERAVSHLTGEARIDAMGFAAAVADDRQRPQEAERILALAEWEATRQGETAKLGSLATFHARALNRIGFATESDAVMEKGRDLLETSAGPLQRLNGENNQAWIAFDRGQVRRAEAHFTHVRDMTDTDDVASRADKEAWRARALFPSGRVDEALAAVTVARELAGRAEVEAPLFLADLAMTEGNTAFGRYDQALAAADRVLDLVERQLQAWENMARAERATVLTRMGRTDEAQREVEKALAATPPGPDGWRWRSRIEAIGLELAVARRQGWDRREAEDLADLFLQAHFFGWAAELLCLIAEEEKDAEVAEEAMALALQVGNPLLAARAAEAGNLWGRSGTAATVRAVKAMEGHVPADWQDDWKARPGVARALEAPEPGDDEAAAENAAVLERALQRAGLSMDGTILSPAQRRSRGLVARRRRRRSPWQVAAAVLGVAAVAALTSVGVAQLGEDPAPVTIVQEVQGPDPTTAEPLALEETQVALPEGVDLFGSAPFRGGPARTGSFEATGTRQVDGFYWTYATGGPILATPVAYGDNLLVPSTDGTLYALNQTTGSVAWTLQTEGRITVSPEVAMAVGTEGQRPALAVVAGDDGVVRARDAVIELQSETWSVPLGARVTSSPVIAEDVVVAATSDGFVHALDLVEGTALWKFPTEGQGLGSISAPLAYHDGVVYVGTQQGYLYLLDAASGAEICNSFVSADIVASPVISDGTVFVPTRGNTIFVRPAGSCQGSVPGRLPLYGTETAVEVSPAIIGDAMYLPSGQFLYAIDLRDNSHLWSPATVDARDAISAAPVVAGEVVYFGTQSGIVRAVDGETGETQWEWDTGTFVRASPVVVDGAVFVAGGDGRIQALGPG